jgi:hypothetical protein
LAPRQPEGIGPPPIQTSPTGFSTGEIREIGAQRYRALQKAMIPTGLSLRMYRHIFRLYIKWRRVVPDEERRVRKNMRIRQGLLDRARTILGAKTETETVEQALELVTFREEVVTGIRRIAGSRSTRDIYIDES